MKRFRRSAKRHIHWLPDQSAWGTSTALAAQTVNSSSVTSKQSLLAEGQVAQAFAGLGAIAGSGIAIPQRFRMPEMGDIIVDAISGKFAFIINGQPSGQTAAGGVWGHYLRFGIIALDITQGPTEAGSDVVQADLSGNKLYELDPGGSGAQVQAGSMRTQGAQWWWRRDFAFPAITWTTGVPSVNTCSELLSPPGAYIYIKPRKRLRPTQELVFCAQMTGVNVNSGGGYTQLVYSTSLRIAAHLNRRRF